MTIQAGDHVRSYDFPTRRDCYIEGVVLAVNEPPERYTIVVLKAVREGVESEPFITCAFPPLNGLEGMFGPTKGVEKI